MTDDGVHLIDRFELPAGYSARPYAGPSDHAEMARVLTDQRRAAGAPELVTAEDLDPAYQHLTDCDPHLDIAMIECGGELAAYCRTAFALMDDGGLDLIPLAPISDAHRSRVLFDALTDATEVHLQKWTEREPTSAATAIRYRTYAGHPGPGQPPTGEASWLEARGYEAIEWSAVLRRPHLDDVPSLPLPDGIELRPAREVDLRTIVVAHCEAFRGEWDFAEPTEKDYSFLLDNPWRDETLWQVAWDGDEVVGQVKPFIIHTENEQEGYLRGYAEFISTHADYRNQGIAKALLARALIALRERGMTEAVLGVDTNNPGGAFQLYTGLGFELESYEAVYTRTFDHASTI